MKSGMAMAIVAAAIGTAVLPAAVGGAPAQGRPAGAGSAAIADECAWTDPFDGHKYDLTPLINNRDYAFQSVYNPTGTVYTYYYNFCKGTSNRGSQTNFCKEGETAICQNDPNNPQWDYSLGGVKSAVWSKLLSGNNAGLRISYPDGGTGTRMSEVRIFCDKSVDTVAFTNESSTVNPDGSILYTITAKSLFACKDAPPVPPSPSPSPPPPPPVVPCKHTDSRNGDVYDLARLQALSPFKVKQREEPRLPYDWDIAVCSRTKCKPTNGPGHDVAACQKLQPNPEPSGLEYNNGNLATLKIEDLQGRLGEQGVEINYSADSNEGDQTCITPQNPNGNRRTVVELYCVSNPIVPDPILKFIAEDPKCTYNFALESKLACPTRAHGAVSNTSTSSAIE